MNAPKETGSAGADAALANTPHPKKPYSKPAVIREQLFETMALACGKTNPSIGQCNSVRKNS